jgi:hypothetical protein
MRILFAVITAVGLAMAPLVAAQDTPTPQHVAVARDTLQALFLDSGVASDASARAFTLLGPQIRQSIYAAPFFQTLTPERQQRLHTYTYNLGAVGSEEAVRGAPAVLDAFAPRFAALFNEAELTDIAAFMRSPEGHSASYRSVMLGVDRAMGGLPSQSPPTPEQQDTERAALERFAGTAGGAAFNARTTEVNAMLGQIGREITGAPHILSRLKRDMCAILEEQCPPGLQN